MSSVIITPEARLTNLALFSPRAMKDKNGNPMGEPKFSCTLIFDEAAQKDPKFLEMKKRAMDAAREKWGNKLPANLRSPFRKGEEKDYEGYGPGKVFINVSSSKDKPDVVGTKRGGDGKLVKITEPSDVRAGDYARASLSVYAYEQMGNKGVAFGLVNVQFLRNGKPLSNRTRADDDFGADTIDTGDDDVEELLGGKPAPNGVLDDDEIPF